MTQIFELLPESLNKRIAGKLFVLRYLLCTL